MLGDGSVIKLSPGRSVLIDERTYAQNRVLLAEQRSLLTVTAVQHTGIGLPAIKYDDIDTLDPAPVPPEPDAPVEEPVADVPAPAESEDEDVNVFLASITSQDDEEQRVEVAAEEPVADETATKKRRGRRA